jgi:hypothetical protein
VRMWRGMSESVTVDGDDSLETAIDKRKGTHMAFRSCFRWFRAGWAQTLPLQSQIVTMDAEARSGDAAGATDDREGR